MYQIPVNSKPNQTFDCIVPVDGKNRKYRYFFYYNTVGKYWQMNVTDTESGEELLVGYPLFSMKYPYDNLISQYAYKGMGSCYLFNVTGVPYTRPTLEDLGTNFLLCWSDTNDNAVS